jgi:pimeloyl-ACP methyl ester carboxylesterase
VRRLSDREHTVTLLTQQHRSIVTSANAWCNPDVQPQELQALGELAGEAVGGITTRIEEMHAGIAERAFGGTGAAAIPARLLHDRIAAAAYTAVRTSLRGAARVSAHAASLTRPPDAPSLQVSVRGRVAIGALNGAFGDRMRDGNNALSIDMAVARPVTDPSPKVAVFLHGLCETEDAWWLGARRHPPYGERLQSELGWAPVYIRYNSGCQIADNGRRLAQLLDELVAAWPVEVEEIALIGHSMGGLVARCACHEGAEQSWISRVRHVFMLGTPHRGVPLEKAATAAGAALELLPETRALANALNLRSAGIKDLCRDCEFPFLPTANQYFVSATITRDAAAPAGRLVGDLLVLPASAWDHAGRGRRLTFPLDHYRHLGSANHFDLLNHPAIYEQIRRWLTGRAALPATG